MSYQIIILLSSFAVSVAIALVILPILKKLKVGQIERTDGPQSHLNKQGTPTMGGIVMMITVLIMSIFLSILYYQNELQTVYKFIPLALVSVGFGIVGFVDDFKKLVLKNTKG